MKLIIVESFQKSKILQNYFKNYKIVSCNGHIVDLDTKSLSIEKTKNKYKPYYKYINVQKKQFVQRLLQQKSGFDEIIIASDMDEEGELIALSLKKFLNLGINEYNRLIFHSLSKTDLLESMKQKNKINKNVIKAQQTRRMIDRLIGYKIQKFLGPLFSIGRNQAILLQMIFDNNENFKKKKNISVITISNEEKQKIIVQLDTFMKDKFPNIILLKTYTTIQWEYPHPLLSTSSIQRLAYVYHKIDAFVCTQVLNTLYNKGLITYIRTDAQVIHPAFIQKCIFEMKKEKKYDINYSRVNKMKNEYEKSSYPHEAIRPVKFKIPNGLSGNEKKIFDLIYFTTIENILQPIQKEVTYMDCKIGNQIKKIKIKEKFLQQGFNNLRKNTKPVKTFVPTNLKITQIESKQIPTAFLFTKISLIQEMKHKGIATPATYDYSIKQLLKKKYISIQKVGIKITEKGIFLLHFIKKFFPKFLHIVFIQNLYTNIESIKKKRIDQFHIIENIDNYIHDQLTKIPKNYNLTEQWRKSIKYLKKKSG